MTTVEHPAAALVEAMLADAGLGLRPARLVDRGDVVAVQLESADREIIAFVDGGDAGQWRTPIVGNGTLRQTHDMARAQHTATGRPLERLTRKRATIPGHRGADSQEWWAMKGLAAADATRVRVVSTTDSWDAVPDASGCVFAAVHVQPGEVPTVTVCTVDGRDVVLPDAFLGR